MLSQKIIICLTAAVLWGIAEGQGPGDRTRENDQRKREQAESRASREWEVQRRAQDREKAEVRAMLEEMLHKTVKEEQLVDTRSRLEGEIHELEQERIELQMREVNLEAEMQRQEVEGNHDDVMILQRDLIDIRADRARHELEIARRTAEFNHQVERRDMRRMRERLDYVSDWRSVAFDPQEAIMMATQAVVEAGLAGEDPHGAAETLEGLLEEIGDLGSRTAIRFALRDLYTELDRPGKAGSHMKQVVIENARALDVARR